MKKAFNFEGPLATFLSRLADLLWLNCMFIICSIPIVTIGASTTAMYYVTLKMARDEEGYITKSFFKSFKENFLQATIIWIILLFVSVVLFMDFRIVSSGSLTEVAVSEGMRKLVSIGTMVVSVFIAFILVYVFPILAKFENSVKNTIKNAFFMSLRHLPYTFALVVLPVVPFVLMYFYNSMLLLIFIMFSLVALASSYMLVKVFDNYIPKESIVSADESVGGKDEKEEQ